MTMVPTLAPREQMAGAVKRTKYPKHDPPGGARLPLQGRARKGSEEGHTVARLARARGKTGPIPARAKAGGNPQAA